jgi:DNA (cytosine-5)-methyltransferase 1
VEILDPIAVLIENVPSVIHDRGNVVHDSIAQLRQAGYYVKTTIVNASEIGLPQRRRRHLLIASRKPFDPEAALSRYRVDRPVSVGEYISDLVDEADRESEVFRSSSTMMADNRRRVLWLFRHEKFDLPDRLRPICHRDGHSYLSMYGRMRWDQPAQTITSGFGCMGQGRFVHPLRPRTLTPHEAARLQGFPDFFSFHDVSKRTSLQRIIGNAVPPKVAATLVVGLIDQQCI